MTDNNYDKRVQASVPVELKERVREMVEHEVFESEAELVRAALWQFLDGESASALAQTDSIQDVETVSAELHNDLKERLDLLAWLNTVLLLLLAGIASRLYEAITREKVEPMQWIEQALRSSIQEQDDARRKLAAGWRAFKRAGRQDGKTQVRGLPDSIR